MSERQSNWRQTSKSTSQPERREAAIILHRQQQRQQICSPHDDHYDGGRLPGVRFNLIGGDKFAFPVSTGERCVCRYLAPLEINDADIDVAEPRDRYESLRVNIGASYGFDDRSTSKSPIVVGGDGRGGAGGPVDDEHSPFWRPQQATGLLFRRRDLQWPASGRRKADCFGPVMQIAQRQDDHFQRTTTTTSDNYYSFYNSIERRRDSHKQQQQHQQATRSIIESPLTIFDYDTINNNNEHLTGSLDSFYDTSYGTNTTTATTHTTDSSVCFNLNLNLNLYNDNDHDEDRDHDDHYNNKQLPSLVFGDNTMRAPTATLYRPTATTIQEPKAIEPPSSPRKLEQEALSQDLSNSDHSTYNNNLNCSMSFGPGGQKAALKLVSGGPSGPASAPQAPPQQQQQQAPNAEHQGRHQTPPQDCCATVSSATSSSVVSGSQQSQQSQQVVASQLVVSNKVVPPQLWHPHQSYVPAYAVHNNPASLGHRLVDGCLSDQESDCSCSNSIECLTLSQHSASLVASSGGGGPAPQLPPPPLSAQHQHHQPHPHHSHAHLMQHQHLPHQLHHQPPHGGYHNHPRHPHAANHQHQPQQGQQTPGTPLNLAQASLPAPPPPPAPPPLVRHNTYTATSETITDASLQQQQQQQHNQVVVVSHHQPGSSSDFDNNPANEQQQHQHQMNSLNSRRHQRAEDLRTSSVDTRNHNGVAGSKQRQTVSFRRSATSAANSNSSATDTQKSQQQRGVYSHSVQVHGGSGSQQRSTGSLHFRSHSSQQPNNQQQHVCAPVSPSIGIGSGSLHRPNSSQSHRQYQQQQLATNFMPPVANYAPFSPLPGGGTPLPLIRTTTTNAIASTNSGTANQMPLLFDPSTCPPLPPITSHRTNSPWMRISSIILTPIGMVIILFIVVSPLLHYLM